MNRSYRVKWEIDVDAETPKEAAEQAMAAQRRADTVATVFTVQNNARPSDLEQVDLPNYNLELLHLIQAAREAKLQLEHVQSAINEESDGPPLDIPWPETDALELALLPFADIAEQAVEAKAQRPHWFRWIVRVDMVETKERKTLAGFEDYGDAEHWAEMIGANPDYEDVLVDEAPLKESAPGQASA